MPEIGFPNKIWLYFIAKKIDEQHYTTLYFNDGVVKESTLPVPLPQEPKGWQDIEIAFGTNQKYFSLNRSFTISLTFVNDGADILRYYAYRGKGYEEELYLIIGKWNRESGKVELEYRGKIDMSKFDDDPVVGVTVNTIEGGALSYLSSNDGTDYEVICDETNNKAIQVLFQGINLQDTFNYSIIAFPVICDANVFRHSLPTVFINNEGDNVGVIFGSQDYGTYASIDELINSPNYTFKAELTNIDLRLKGTYKVQLISTSHSGTYTLNYLISDKTSITQHTIQSQSFSADGILEFDFDVPISLLQGQALYLEAEYDNSGTTSGNDLNVLETNFSISFTSYNPDSTAYALFVYDYMQQLTLKMTDGRFGFDSNFFKNRKDLVVTCGDALRNTDKTSANSPIKNYIISASWQDAFQSLSSIYDLGVKVINDVIFIEPKTDLYKDDTQIFDLGEVNNLSISFAYDYLVNTINAGYPDQRYDQRNGKYEFNSTQQYSLPVTSVNKPLDIQSKFRADAFGIEFIRGLANQNTTDNLGDKTPFFVVIDEGSGSNTFMDLTAIKNAGSLFVGKIAYDTITNSGGSESYFSVNFSNTDFTYIFAQPYSININSNIYGTISGSGSAAFDLKLNGTSIASQTVPATRGFFRADLSAVKSLNSGDIITVEVDITLGATINVTSASIDLFNGLINPPTTYHLKKLAYDSIMGVVDDTVYNVEISPKRQVLAHGAYLKSLLYMLQDEKINFVTGAKNTQLSTTLNGVTIAENANINIVDLPDPIFLPFEISFKAPSPYTTAKTLSNLGTGYIKATFNGHDIYGLPIGEMSAKPATDEVPTWKMLAAPNNNIALLTELKTLQLIIADNTKMVKIFYNCPVQFVKYNFSTPSGIHHKDVWDDWADQRWSRWTQQPFYFQKWQKSDVIKIPVVTSGIGQLGLYVTDKDGNDYSNQLFATVTEPSILLPYTLQIATIDLSTFDEGEYLFTIKAGSTPLAVSEWQDVKVDQPDTYRFDYSNSYNKPNYFTSWGTLTFRCEALFIPYEPDATFTDYEDEPGDVELLNAVPSMKRTLIVGASEYKAAAPEYISLKVNEILSLNTVNIEGVEYTRLPDSKFSITKPDDKGYPFYYASIDVKRAINDTGLTIDASGVEIPKPMVAYTLDAAMFGGGSDVINITVGDE